MVEPVITRRLERFVVAKRVDANGAVDFLPVGVEAVQVRWCQHWVESGDLLGGCDGVVVLSSCLSDGVGMVLRRGAGASIGRRNRRHNQQSRSIPTVLSFFRLFGVLSSLSQNPVQDLEQREDANKHNSVLRNLHSKRRRHIQRPLRDAAFDLDWCFRFTDNITIFITCFMFLAEI